MKRKIFTSSFLLIILFNSISAQVIQFQNPSFEGTPGTPHVTPPLWDICQPGMTPDIQPGVWGVTLAPSNGSSYIGLCNQISGSWLEGANQALLNPLVSGTTYSFFIDLATTNSTVGGITPGCIELQVYANTGGNSGCDMSNLVWSSGDITSLTWQTYHVSFTATQNWTNIVFMSHNLGCTDCPYIMMDNLSSNPDNVFPVSDTTICTDTFTICADPWFDSYLWSTGDTTQTITVTNSGDYYVTAIYNVSDTIVDSIHVTLTQPYLNLILGNDTTVCGSGNINLDAGTGFLQYLWNTGAFGQSINVNQTGLYSVYTTDTAYCNYADTIKVVINPAQSLHLGNDTAFCNYGTYTLDASVAFDSYQWSTSDTTQTTTVDSTGTYYVTATNIQCSATVIDSINITFHAVPAAYAGIDDTICKGASTSLSATGGGTYAWSPAFGLSCTSCANPTASPAYTTTYVVTVTNSSGCTASDNVTVNVFTAPTSSSPASCGLNNGSATANPSGGSGLYSYLWNTTPQQNTQTATGLAAATYTVTVTDIGLGCSVTASAVVINVAAPVVTIINKVLPNCGTLNGSMTASVSGGTPPYSYLWGSSPQQTTQTAVNLPSGIFCVTVTDANSCQTIKCDSINTIPFNPPEICMVTADTATNHIRVVWEKDTTTNGILYYYIYRESSVSGIYNLIDFWDYSNTSTYLDVSANALQQAYRYKISIYDLCNMESQQSTYHQSIHLTVSSGSSGSWDLQWNDYLGFVFSTYNIYRGTGTGNLTYLNSISSNFTSYSDLTPPPGNVYYLVEAVRPAACNPSKSGNSFSSSISNIASSVGSGIDEMNTDNDFQIIPNPANNDLTIISSLKSEIEILNIEGQILKKENSKNNTTTFDISDLASGMYFVKVIPIAIGTEKGIAVKKFIKE